ncbi:hypothetical protein LOTGIDRAFT_166348 [Lottia gigantea]|uniref:Uncharacterized protein n=1 Tax=Lottia gigantea TaxID=225164 RepID=V3ZTP7_LOTGI|nr:hypothetical protein LOTGIDRAFT_166348 [Lottia gigantea]ESO87757.1 hypothetical protein LOTGIDRAFT_166348 [Lottia gigantea]
MGKQKNGKKERRESLGLGELTRSGKSKVEEERELLKLQQEGILYLDDIRIGESGFSYNIMNEDRSRRKSRTQIPERMRPFSTKTKRPWLCQNPMKLSNPKPQDFLLGLEPLGRFYQRRLLERKVTDQEWLQLKRAESRMMREETRERTYKDKKAKETVKKPKINRELCVDLTQRHSKDEDKDQLY